MVNTRTGSVSNTNAGGGAANSERGKKAGAESPILLLRDEADRTPCSVCNAMKGCKKWINCDRCKAWCHTNCAKIEQNDFEHLQRTKNLAIKWYCPQCMSEMSQGSDPNDKLAQTDAKVSTLVKIVETLQTENQMILSMLQKTGGSINEQVKVQIQEYFEEEKERDMRRNNIVVFNVDENDLAGDEEKDSDIALMKEVLRDVCPEIKQNLDQVKVILT